jgi:PAS domain S-box-containing protein
MVDAQPLSLANAAVTPDANAPATFAAAGPVVARHWQTVVLAAILVVTVCVASWIYSETTRVADELLPVMTSKGVGQLNQIMQWRLLVVVMVLGTGALLILVTFSGFQFSDRAWQRRMKADFSDWESLTSQLRMQVSEKLALESLLLRDRKTLEAQLAGLTRVNGELHEELTRQKRAEQMERSLPRSRPELTPSKAVLDVHVQARFEEMQKRQRQYELILNSAGEGICGINPGGIIIYVNPAAARLMGLEVKTMVGRKEVEVFGDLARDDVATALNLAVGTPMDVVLKRTDGAIFNAEFVRSPIDENGGLVGRVVLFKDITERKKSAEALEIKAAELTRSNAELEQFAFVASHDLQEPLRKIRAFGDRLKTKCEAALPEEGADYLERMQNAAARMQTLINDLLTFSRVISRTEPFALVDLRQITQEVLGDLEVRIEKSGAVVVVGDLPKIEADALQLRQLLQNLIGNALKFQPPNAKPKVEIGGRIVAGREGNVPAQLEMNQPVRSLAPDEQPYFQLVIKDNGIGFDEKYLDRIFAVFQRLHGRQEYDGTGIGLAVCRRIVDRHKGAITAKSKPGEGATFIVTLPVHHQAKDKSPS